MAERLESFPVRVGPGGIPKHPWEEWLDGSVWRLTQGEDFTCKMQSLRVQANARATARGQRLRAVIDHEAHTLTMQAWSPNGNGAA